MTSSGTYNFSLSNADGVLAAFDRIGLAPTDLKQRHFLTARRELNLLFAEWSNKQVNLWKVELLTVTLVAATATYTIPDKVVMVLDAYYSINQGQSDQTDLIMNPISRDQYAGYPQKQMPGPPTMYWFDRLKTSPTITTFPVYDGSPTAAYINYYACVQVQDALLPGGETPDIPLLWYDALVAGLSLRLARVFARGLMADCRMDAKDAWDTAAAQNIENTNVNITPNIGSYYR